ncbi:MAG: xanthine dehydrogenase family protein molybdopterin-binding subunit [Firmicutes bacterium]|nr:xanthine dehydrogenase family protein molybdopterin-binding subunit [Bacillota bacterium]
MKEIVGKSIHRIDGWDKVTGKLQYPSDIYLSDMLYLKLVRAECPHALIKDIDTSVAKEVDGVYLFTAEDVKKNSFGNIIKDQPVFCDKVVRFYGEPVAMVAAPTKELAEYAAKKVRVDYKPLPVVNDPEEALNEDAAKLHPNGNLLQKINHNKEDVVKGFSDSTVIISDTFEVPMVDHAYMEPEAGVSYIDDNGKLTVLAGTQNPFHDQREISEALGIPLERVTVKALLTGGGFGGKDGNTVQIYLALATMLTGRPTKLTFSREESLITSYKRHPAKIKVKMGVAEDGTIRAFEGTVYFDTGAYAALGPAVLGLGIEHFHGPYQIENVKLDGYLVYTNKPPASAMRGFGAPQVLFATETLLNRAAKKLGIDPIDIRLKNALEVGGKGPFGQNMEHSVGLKEALTMAKESSLWQEKNDNTDPYAAYGMAAGFLSCGMGAGIPDNAKVEIEKNCDKYLVKVGTVEIGQGNLTAFTQIAAQALGVSTDKIEIISADTDNTYDCGSTAASRSTYITGNAIIKAVKDLKEKGGSIGVGKADFPESSRKDIGIGLPHVMYTFLVNLVKLRLNPLTGEIKLLDIVAITEAGKIINPCSLAGQIQGGVVQGAGYALMENMGFAKGILKQKDLSTYLIPTAKDICDIQSLTVDAYEHSGPFGAKGAAEVGTVAITPAITGCLTNKWDIVINRLPISREEIVNQLQKSGVIEQYIS